MRENEKLKEMFLKHVVAVDSGLSKKDQLYNLAEHDPDWVYHAQLGPPKIARRTDTIGSILRDSATGAIFGGSKCPVHKATPGPP